jgi:hypothetical protein
MKIFFKKNFNARLSKSKILFLVTGTENKSKTECTKYGDKNNNGIRNYCNYVWHRRYEGNVLLEPPTFAIGNPCFRGTMTKKKCIEIGGDYVE